MKNTEKRFYVYIYLDPRKPGIFSYLNLKFDFEPIYVGKGTEKRINGHLNENLRSKYPNNFFYNKLDKIIRDGFTPISFKLYDNLTEFKAEDLEVRTINIIGRKDLKQGSLTNLTNGAEGKSHIVKESTKKILSEKNSGENHPQFGTTHTQERKDKRKESMKEYEGYSAYDFWVLKFGKEEADRRQEESVRKNKETAIKNGTYKKSNRQKLIDKYGPEEAERRSIESHRKSAETKRLRKEAGVAYKTPGPKKP